MGNERSRINPDGMYVGKVYSQMKRVKINTTFQGRRELWRSDHNHSPAPLALLGQWWRDWMRWRWEWRDLPSLDEWSPLFPRSSPHVVSGDAPQWGEVEAEWWRSTMERWWRCPKRGGWETKWKRKQNKQNEKMGVLQHPLYIVLVFPWLVFETV